jgi:hypothetical protein
VNKLDNADKNEISDFSDNITHLRYITFDVVKEYNEYEEPHSTSLNENNELENKFGLTQSEMWFNTLSDEHKKYVQELVHIWFCQASAS